MLKALEMIGFKSFADKTRFEFPPGITVVVGPNGSGKSNVVDAVKWVLGEQSVKSLRGKEMADVIFNGSGARRAMNYAETTLTFSNEDGRLPIDTPEVHVTRRVYRSGEGEYLINRQPGRLRDIRDLFAGTGVSTQAYSIIEQGKVDGMLQSSPRDRRMIFEEAAGISRFKAKKLDALRRLERVDQNLLRLSDIVEEVANRLRMVRNQATKARRYKEYTDRLQELRTQVGLADWRHISECLAAYEAELAALRLEAQTQQAALQTHERSAADVEEKLHAAEQTLRDAERRASENRERIAAEESRRGHESQFILELHEAELRLRRQQAALSGRAEDLTAKLQETEAEAAAAEQEYAAVRGAVDSADRELSELAVQLADVQKRRESKVAQQTDSLRLAGRHAHEINALEGAVVAAGELQHRHTRRLAQLAESRERFAREFNEHEARRRELAVQLALREADLHEAQERLRTAQAERDQSQSELSSLRQQQSGAAERAALLDELEKRQEGVNDGVKELLARARQTSSGPFSQIEGLVADIVQVQVDAAPLIEIALGDKAGYLVARPGDELREWFQNDAHRLAGRVGIVQLDAPFYRSPLHAIELKGHPGVIARADSFVETDAEYKGLAERLLSDTWVVEDMAQALALSRGAGKGLNFVTREGEWVGADGVVCIGPRRHATGLISRRSELRVLREQLAGFEAGIRGFVDQIADLRANVTQGQEAADALIKQCDALKQESATVQLHIRGLEERQSQLTEQVAAAEEELRAAQVEQQQGAASLQIRQQELADMEAALAAMEASVADDEVRIESINARRQECVQEATSAKVELAKSEQRREHLRTRLQQFQQDHEERQRAVYDADHDLAVNAERALRAQLAILRATGQLAELFLRKEELVRQNDAEDRARQTLRAERTQLAAEAQRVRDKLRKVENRIHAQELEAEKFRHERQTLADRLREDYDIDLAALEREPSEEDLQEREAVEAEIAELRRKLNHLGGVNTEALDELDELETRYEDLSAQFQDLSAAKVSLEQIIDKINLDSRRLFQETLDTVREHFKTLFRKMFGGGQADIVLDDEGDVLESGIEIVARPPGKEPRSISLLSGGEKTLTCVALLLAIFRSRPSPFCILDEVDAALDEANIGRFVGVLEEFLTMTQFIVITHSKKTMTCAGTLYGVTMQESGISKRVSVRFEDVTDNGEILESAHRRTAEEEQQAGASTAAANDAAADDAEAA